MPRRSSQQARSFSNASSSGSSSEMPAAYEPIHLLQKMPLQEVLRMALLGLHERITAERALAIGLGVLVLLVCCGGVLVVAKLGGTLTSSGRATPTAASPIFRCTSSTKPRESARNPDCVSAGQPGAPGTAEFRQAVPRLPDEPADAGDREQQSQQGHRSAGCRNPQRCRLYLRVHR
mgnify:CR=1 FL=1